jgi:hypothetical protein
MCARLAVPLVAAACSAALAPAPAAAQTATTGTPQSLFTHQIATDKGTSPDIRAALRARQVFVDERITFADLTGDGRQDAIVRVDDGGAAGTIAVYVYSTDGAKKLRAIYRNQRVFRGLVAVQGATFLLSTPRYAAGDELCCPAELLERTLTWSTRAHRLVLRGTRQVPAPV